MVQFTVTNSCNKYTGNLDIRFSSPSLTVAKITVALFVILFSSPKIRVEISTLLLLDIWFSSPSVSVEINTVVTLVI
jgi:hypothetical protein